MKDKGFDEMIHDFDGFMERHGYYRINKAAEYLGLKPVSVRQRVARGWYSSVTIGNVKYIPFDEFRKG